jgi:hypothetical protein
MAQSDIPANHSSQYGGVGKTNVQPQGQTEGVYGNDPMVTRREPDPPTELLP